MRLKQETDVSGPETQMVMNKGYKKTEETRLLYSLDPRRKKKEDDRQTNSAFKDGTRKGKRATTPCEFQTRVSISPKVVERDREECVSAH